MAPPSFCACGAWASWGSLAAPEDVAAWQAAHAACAPRPVEPTLAGIRFETEDEAIEIMRIMRPTHYVGRLGVSLLVRPRAPAAWPEPASADLSP